MKSNHTIRTLFLTVLAEIIGFGILIPIVPLLFTEPSSQYFILPGKYSLDTGYILLGLLIGLYPLSQFFATPILGELSDIYGRRKVIQVSIVGTIVSTLIFAFGLMTANIPLLFLSRVSNGLTGGLISVAQATIADVSERDDKSRNFGILGAAFGTGFILGPFLGGLLSSGIIPAFTLTTPFWFAAALSAVSLIYVSLKLEETSPMENRRIDWKKPLNQISRGLEIPGLRKLFAANFFYFSGFAFFTSFISVFLIKRFSFTQFDIGNFFLYVGVLVIIGQTVLVPRVFSRFKESRVMPYTLFLTGLFILLQFFPSNLWIYLAIIPFFGFSNALTQVSLNTLVSNGASEKEQGLALGTNQSLRALGNAIPSILSGVSAALFTPGTPILIAGSIVILTAMGYKLVTR